MPKKKSKDNVETTEQESGKKWEYVEKSEQEEQVEAEGLLADEKGISDYDLMDKDEVIEALKVAKDEATANFERFARAQAELKNVQRTSEESVKTARKFALQSFSKELVTVVENLERSLESSGPIDELDESAKKVLEGVELTHKSLISVFEKFGIEELNPLNEEFNPDFHEAISMVPNPDLEPNTIMQVLQKGYTLNKRLIRPAMVIVTTK